MLNILLPIAGPNTFFDSHEYPFPKPLIEVLGASMIERVVDNLNTINELKRFIFLIRNEDCIKFHIDNTLRLLTGESAIIIKVQGETKGALCSALLAIEHIENDSQLLIANSDQIFSNNLPSYFERVRSVDGDAACMTFCSVHPRWSYVKVNENNTIIQASEKNPISKHAVAGMYFFKKGEDFIEAAKRSILKNASTDGRFFISSAINELTLMGKRAVSVEVDNSDYVSFYSPQKIAEYEMSQL
jgi:dTDP-glucose pyrophosphorylase